MAPLTALRQLVEPNPDEDRILAEVEFPTGYVIGRRFVAMAIVGLGALVSLLLGDDGDDRVTIGLILVPVIPWVLEFAGIEASRLWRSVVVLVPSFLVLVLTLRGTIGTSDGLTPVGAEVALFIVFLLMADFWNAPRLQVALAFPMVYVVALSRFVIAGELVNTIIWSFATTFMVVATMGIRFGCLAMTRTKEALAAQALNEERRHVARDIHDVVAHTLAVTMLHITAARMAVHRGAPTDALEALEEAERHGRSSLGDVRRIVRLLRSEDRRVSLFAQPDLGALDQLVDGYRTAGLPVELDVQGGTDHVAPVASVTLYRVVQEALANAARHGHGPASVNLRFVDGSAVLSVCNAGGANGRARRPQGSGLVGMEERVLAAGGCLDAGPTDGGWAVRANVPVGGPVGARTAVPT
jgi:signal transduction histidine kinase